MCGKPLPLMEIHVSRLLWVILKTILSFGFACLFPSSLVNFKILILLYLFVLKAVGQIIMLLGEVKIEYNWRYFSSVFRSTFSHHTKFGSVCVHGTLYFLCTCKNLYGTIAVKVYTCFDLISSWFPYQYYAPFCPHTFK